jgi:hypothetical protein
MLETLKLKMNFISFFLLLISFGFFFLKIGEWKFFINLSDINGHFTLVPSRIRTQHLKIYNAKLLPLS